jgi:hypothetical protein
MRPFIHVVKPAGLPGNAAGSVLKEPCMAVSRPSLGAPRISRSDRVLWFVGIAATLGLAVALWSQAGSEVFSAMMTGMLALCF